MKLLVVLTTLVLTVTACSTISGRIASRDREVALRQKEVDYKQRGDGHLPSVVNSDAGIAGEKIRVGVYGNLDTGQLDRL